MIKETVMGTDPGLGKLIVRRNALKASVAGAILVLAGCTAAQLQSVNSGISQALQDIQGIAAGLPGVEVILQGIGVTVPAQVNTLIGTVVADASKIGTAALSNQGTLAKEILGALPVIVSLIPGGAPLGAMMILNAALSLAPGIAAAFGLTGATTGAPVYTPEHAREILRIAAVK